MSKCLCFGVFIGALSLSSTSFAEDKFCNQILGDQHHETILDQTPASDLPLPKSLVEQLRKHPITNWAEYIKTRSLSLDFAINVPMMMMDDPQTKAESHQARLMAKYLKVLFPSSDIQFNSAHLSPETRNKRNIQLTIFDMGETEIKGDIAYRIYSVENRVDEMPIPLLKAGTPHPLPSLMSKSELRRKLGFPLETKRIASLYVASVDVLDQYPHLLTSLEKTNSFDHIIVSFNKSELGFEESEHFPGMTKLSEVALGQPVGKLIWNDSLYRMPYIYTMSDLAVVAGNINFLEPLNARVPTILYQSKEMRTEYNASVMNHMISQAINSGGFAKAGTPLALDKELQKIMAKAPKVLPPALLIKNGKSNFDRSLTACLRC